MMDLFAHAAANDAKLAGMKQAKDNANETWFDLMLRLVDLTCREQLLFTSDDVEERYAAMPAPKPETHDGRAFGAVMRQAARNGWCEKTNTVRDSTRASLHKSPRAIWRSKLYVHGK